MTAWHVVLIASVACLALKVLGYLVPPRWVSGPRATRTADLLTVALLAALIAVQTLERSQSIEIDARIPALLVAAVLLVFRAPFLVVVLAAALIAALLRAGGWAA